MVMQLGTSGYSYADWKGLFYPDRCSNTNMLPFYAGRFDTVELNFSYYRMPEADQLSRLASRAREVNPAFQFSIKAHKTLTHEIGAGWQRDADAFRDAIAGLASSDSLAAVLLQFPHSFHYTTQNRRHLAALLESLQGHACACEFRSREWLGQRVYQGLRDRGAALVAVDEPELEGLLPPVAIPTADFGYVRFHGRNKENWWRGTNASRYDYLYSKEELQEWVPRIQELGGAEKTIYVYFNNHWRAQAVENALQFKNLTVLPKED